MNSKKKYADIFVGITSKDEKLRSRHKKVLEIFSNQNFNRILDIGCGDGYFTALVGKACGAKEVYGVDISEKGVEMARKNGIKAFKVDVDEERLPFDDNYFDVVTALEVIEHLFNPDHFLKEVYRVLKPNGVFVLSTPNLAAIHNRIALLFGYQPPAIPVSLNKSVGHFAVSAGGAAPDHIRFFTLRSIKKLLEVHNFKIVEVQGSCAQLRENMRFKKFLKMLDKFFSYFPSLAYRLIVVCTK